MPLTLKKVDYSYHPGTVLQTPALSAVSLMLEPGEFVGLMGPTGCGKSTLLQVAAGLLPPQKGSAETDGVAGMVFQNPDHQLFESTLEREIAFAPKCQGLPEDMVLQRVDEALRAVGLDRPELRERSPFALSGGEKRRAALAGILAMDPRYLLLDEPLAGLDAEGAEILLQCLHERCRKGTAILMAAHDPDVICENATRVIRMKEGRIVFDGTPEEAFDDGAVPDADPADLGHVRETVIRLREAGIRLPDGITRFRELTAALRQVLEERNAHV
ncbi:MAG: ATP-binding cassette domain-containing protein [Flexilinea sp.]|nr:ATP-binding cassette domain-containing protein [Flexilinea sp.]